MTSLEIPPEIQGPERVRLERLLASDPVLFSAALKTLLNIRAKAPQTYQPRQCPASPAAEDDESDGWHP